MVEQVIMHSFLPVFVQRQREHGEQDAWRLASTTFNLLITLMAIIAVVGMLFTRQILPLFVPDWFSATATVDPRLIPLLILLTRWMLVAVIFMSTSSLTYCLLNSYKQFALPASADLVLKGAVLLFAILFAHAWGPYALAVGFVCGALAKLAVHGIGLRQQLQEYRPVIAISHPGFKRFLILALPLLAGVLVSILRQVMDQRFTSSLASGSLTALKFAKTLTDTPVTIFPYAFGIALFPFLADIAVAGDKARLRQMLMSATRMMILIFIPLAVLIIMLREPLVIAVFGPKSLQAAEPLQLYACGMLVGALEIIVLQFFFAMSDTLWPTIIGFAVVPLHIGMSYLGVYDWKIGVLGIALALLVSKGTKVFILYALIRKRLGALEGRKTLILLGKVALSLLPMFLLLWAAVNFLPEPGAVKGRLQKVLVLVPYFLTGGVGLATYLFVLHALHVDEMTLLLARVRGKLRRGHSSANA
jgi:putative peptidoglycan lipid II flippase